MTGSELAAALLEKLRTMLPETEVHAAFSGSMTRKPEKPVLCIGLLSETRAEDGGSAKLGVWLYTPPSAVPGDLFAAVCAALQEIPCTVRSVTRGETKYDGTAGCLVTPCTILAVTAAAENRTAVAINGVGYWADSVSVSTEMQTKRYGSVGEEKPHTVVNGAKTYRVTLAGFTGGTELLGLESFVTETAGVRYAPCAWKRIEPDRLVLEAGGAENVTEGGDNA
ncbi:MAG: hypothetical protein ACI4GO_05490 [Hominenteromicrobium sp.]